MEMNLKWHEEHARKCLDKLFSQSKNSLQWAWFPEPNDPPDLWLDLDGKRFAVEVTSINDTNSLGQNSHKSDALYENAVVEVVKRLNNSELVSGKWVLFSYPTPDVVKTATGLKEKLTNFFTSPIHLKYMQRTIKLENGYKAELRKLKFEGNEIIALNSDAGQAAGEHLDYWLENELLNCICNKSKKLLNKGIVDSRILAINDFFGLRTDKWEEHLTTGSIKFDAIFRITAHEAIQVVASNNFPWISTTNDQ